MQRTQAAIGGLARPAPFGRVRRSAAILLTTASLAALLCQVPQATALDCGDGAPPADIATPAALYETLRDRTDAQLLAIGFGQKPVDAACAWIYEVKMLTASGSVVELDFAAQDLDLVGARGPDNDRDVAKLVQGLGGNASTLITGSKGGGGHGASGGGSDDGDGGNSGSGSGSSGSGEGGDGGNSGSGSGNSGSGGGDDGGGGDDDGGGSEGGEGGNSGSGSGGDGGGEGGDD